MKLTILSENLQKKINIANKAISLKNQLPILSNLLLETKGDYLHIYSTDLEIGIETKILAEIEEQGSIAIPAKLLQEVIGTFPSDKLILTADEKNLKIQGKKAQVTIALSPKEEFPNLYEDLGTELITFEKGQIKNIFNKIIFATSIETTRPALSGVLLEKRQNRVVVVATDGYRLSYEEIPGAVSTREKVIIPSRLIKEAISLSEEGQVKVMTSEKENQLVFAQDETILVGRTIEAEFPNYQKVIPVDEATIVSFDREELLAAVKTSSIFARTGSNTITLSLKKEAILVSAKAAQIGENQVEVECELKGEENDIAFNSRFLLESLNNISGTDMSLSMTGPLNPGVFKISGNPHFLHLIMPIRT